MKRIVLSAILILLLSSFADAQWFPRSQPELDFVPNVSDPELLELYTDFNLRWFSGKLPVPDVINWDTTFEQPRHLAITYGMKVPDRGKIVQLFFVPRYLKGCASCTQWVMAHEMCHVKLYMDGRDEGLSHGKKFQGCMKKLAKKGAFAEVW